MVDHQTLTEKQKTQHNFILPTTVNEEMILSVNQPPKDSRNNYKKTILNVCDSMGLLTVSVLLRHQEKESQNIHDMDIHTMHHCPPVVICGIAEQDIKRLVHLIYFLCIGEIVFFWNTCYIQMQKKEKKRQRMKRAGGRT